MGKVVDLPRHGPACSGHDDSAEPKGVTREDTNALSLLRQP
jgi:hypothetical protein